MEFKLRQKSTATVCDIDRVFATIGLEFFDKLFPAKSKTSRGQPAKKSLEFLNELFSAKSKT